MSSWSPCAYIEALNICGLPVDFEGDMPTLDLLFDQNVSIVDDWMDDATERSKIAFAAAVVEWIAWRLDGLVGDDALHELARALWAAMVDIRYWKGVHREQPNPGGPLDWISYATWQEAEALMRLSREGKGSPENVVDLVLLARHVLPKSARSTFKQWLLVVLDKRIGVHWQLDGDPRSRAARLGALVSREALDPTRPLDEAAMPAQVKALLRKVDWRQNRYLRSPEELRALGYVGTPYAL